MSQDSLTKARASPPAAEPPAPPSLDYAAPAADLLTNTVVDSTQNTRLHFAALDGDLPLLSSLLGAGADPNVTNEMGQTALHAAAAGSSVEAVKMLLHGGADPNLLSQDGRSCISEAAFADNTDTIAHLIESGRVTAATINHRDLDSYTPLHICAMYGRTLSCQELLKSPVIDPFVTSRNGMNAFHMAVVREEWATAAFLVTAGFDINGRTSSGDTILHVSIRSPSPSSHTLLKGITTRLTGLDYGATDAEGFTPLMRAVAVGDKAKFDAVLPKSEASVNTLNPLTNGEGEHETENLSLFCILKYSNERNSSDRDEMPGTPKHRSKVRTSLEASFASSALHLAASSGLEWAVTDLIERGRADPELADAKCRTPLQVAVAGGHRRVVKYLVEQLGAEHEAREGVYGFSSLGMAAFFCNFEMVSYLLLRVGARVNSRARDGTTPYVIASEAHKALLAEQGPGTEAPIAREVSLEEEELRGGSMDLTGFDRAPSKDSGGTKSPLRGSSLSLAPSLPDSLEFVLPGPHHHEMRSSNPSLDPPSDHGAASAARPSQGFSPLSHHAKKSYEGGAAGGAASDKGDAAGDAGGAGGAAPAAGKGMRTSTSVQSLAQLQTILGGVRLRAARSDAPPTPQSQAQSQAEGMPPAVRSASQVSGAGLTDLLPGTAAAAEAVKELLASNGGKDTRPDDARLFLRAVAVGNVEQVRLLLRWVDVNSRQPESGRTALHVAVGGQATPNHLTILKTLLAIPGIEIMAADKQGKTPRDLAVASGNQEAIDTLTRALVEL